MKRLLLALGFAGLLGMAGCEQDRRNTEAKLNTPAPDFGSRFVTACPECGAPQRPYRVTGTKSFYRCSGQPPKFKYHSEDKWSHAIDREVEQ